MKDKKYMKWIPEYVRDSDHDYIIYEIDESNFMARYHDPMFMPRHQWSNWLPTESFIIDLKNSVELTEEEIFLELL